MSSRGSKEDSESWEMENKAPTIPMPSGLLGARFVGRRLSQIRADENRETMSTFVCPYCDQTSLIDQLIIDPSVGQQEASKLPSPSLSGGSSFSGRLKEKMSVSSRLLKTKFKQSSCEIKQGVSVAKGRLKQNAALVKDSLNIVLDETKQSLSRKMAPVSEQEYHSFGELDDYYVVEAEKSQHRHTDLPETDNSIEFSAKMLENTQRSSMDGCAKPIAQTCSASMHSVSSDLKIEVDYSSNQIRANELAEKELSPLAKFDATDDTENKPFWCARMCVTSCAADASVKVAPAKEEPEETESSQIESSEPSKEPSAMDGNAAFTRRNACRRKSAKEYSRRLQEPDADEKLFHSIRKISANSAERLLEKTESFGSKTPPLPRPPSPPSPVPQEIPSPASISLPRRKSSRISALTRSPHAPATRRDDSAPPFVYDSVFNEKVKDLMPITRLLERAQLYGASGLSTEYFYLSNMPHVDTFKISKMSVNAWKNRYCDMLCYDKTRVKLNPMNKKDKTDYINASFVDGYKHKNAYICCQGPTDKTCADFWKMVWQYNVRLIVMTTRVMEKKRRKCAPYWPTDENEVLQHGECTIINSKTYTTDTRAVCSLTVKHAQFSDLRTVYHLLFLVWPDYGVPSSADSFLDLVFTARTLQEAGTALIPNWRLHPNGPPLVIHCSAGVGRSGTFMCADICMRMLDDIQKVNVRNVLELIRKQRAFAVQTAEQYLFCHTAIFEYAKTQKLLPVDVQIPQLVEKDG